MLVKYRSHIFTLNRDSEFVITSNGCALHFVTGSKTFCTLEFEGLHQAIKAYDHLWNFLKDEKPSCDLDKWLFV